MFSRIFKAPHGFVIAAFEISLTTLSAFLADLLLSDRQPIDRVEQALRAMIAKKALKVVIQGAAAK